MAPAVNSGSPSDESFSAMPKVINTLRSAAISHLEPSELSSTIGQLEYLSPGGRCNGDRCS